MFSPLYFEVFNGFEISPQIGFLGHVASAFGMIRNSLQLPSYLSFSFSFFGIPGGSPLGQALGSGLTFCVERLTSVWTEWSLVHFVMVIIPEERGTTVCVVREGFREVTCKLRFEG